MSFGPLWLGGGSFLRRCGLVLLTAGERDETTADVSTANKAAQALTHKSATGNPLSPQPETVQYCCAIQGRLELLDSAGLWVDRQWLN